MPEYSDVRYLHAKRTVDDRALNRGVIDACRQHLTQLRQSPLSVLELGAGVGTMVSRLADWGVLESANFVLLDRDAESLRAARSHLASWSDKPDDRGARLLMGSEPARSSVRFVHADAFEFLERPEQRGRFDFVMANAVLDLMDLTPALTSIWQVLRPGGCFWFSINFDGETIFLPEHDYDDKVMQLYHRSMDERVRDGKPAGDSKTGRRLLTRIGATGAHLVAAGSSDWVVFPRQGAYPDDEKYFLQHIVNTICVALTGHAELDPSRFAAWLATRHAQIERSELCYVAHQLDVFGDVPTSALVGP